MDYIVELALQALKYLKIISIVYSRTTTIFVNSHCPFILYNFAQRDFTISATICGKN